MRTMLLSLRKLKIDYSLWMKDMSRDFRQMRMNRSTLESR